MPKGLEIVGGQATAPGSTLTSLTMNATNSSTPSGGATTRPASGVSAVRGCMTTCKASGLGFPRPIPLTCNPWGRGSGWYRRTP